MKPLNILFVLLLSLTLAACGSNSAIVSNPPIAQPTPVTPTQPAIPPAQVTEAQPPQAARVGSLQFPELNDSQGAVEVLVRPLDLESQAEKLTFEVSLNTHSVDLSMDLATLAILTTDTGLTVQASAWDGPRGGHHVSGKLSFPDVDLRQGDVQALPFPDASFDKAVATFVFCSVPDPVLGLSEIRRVLRPGGQVYLLEHMRSAHPFLGELMDLLNPMVVRMMGANINRQTVSNVQKSGLELVEVENLRLGGIFKLIIARRQGIYKPVL